MPPMEPPMHTAICFTPSESSTSLWMRTSSRTVHSGNSGPYLSLYSPSMVTGEADPYGLPNEFRQMMKNLVGSNARSLPISGPHQSFTSADPVNACAISMQLSPLSLSLPHVLYATGTLKILSPDSSVNSGTSTIVCPETSFENGFSVCSSTILNPMARCLIETHEDSISLVRGILTLRLTSQSYYRSGLKGTRSQLSMGNRKTSQQLFVVQLDLNNMALEDKNYMRLVWFAQKYPSQHVFAFAGGLTLANSTQHEIRPVYSSLGRVRAPNLVPLINHEWLENTLEWIAYASLNAPQLSAFDRTDDNVSTWPQTADLGQELELYKISFSGLLATTFAENLLQLCPFSWTAIVKHGVQDTNVAYYKSEHRPGPNVQVLLKNADSFQLVQLAFRVRIQLVEVVVLHDLAPVVEHHYSVARLDRTQPVRNADRGQSGFLSQPQRALDGLLRLGVQGRRGLVQNQNAWAQKQLAPLAVGVRDVHSVLGLVAQQERSGQRYPLFLTPAQLRSFRPNHRVQLVREIIDKLGTVGQIAHFLDLFVRGIHLAVRDVFSECSRKQHRLLLNNSRLFSEIGQTHFCQWLPINDYLAGLWLVVPQQQLCNCALSASTRTNKTHMVALVDFQLQVVEHLVRWTSRILE
ncbi:hypothetical protein OGAPHI_002419 [Ogataea philodendri]|uniref:Uncharacterized protein n=1 Tax=Ogataea philodendri TaxID=1378263 RepID=A0A9P8PBT0_9ASCO|nr:uncharacterized protein OGAPHI_002419 [Ogataea philodendri]KAH3668665.1 hypothetical protein OGAPHI_002419 [Ogataea philodendri]